MKTCIKCGETKPIDEFSKVRNVCKICRSQYDKECYLKNKEKRLKYAKEYQLKNKEKIREYDKEYHLKNKEKRNKRKKKEYRLKNKEEIKEYYQKNKEKRLKYAKEYYLRNKEKRNEYVRNRTKTDPKFRLNKNVRNVIYQSLHGNKNGAHWEDLVGYTLNDLKKHLEKQFTDGMNWNNYGEWHIDHIIPLSAFNFTKPKHIGFRKAWELENLQPLWAEENLSKNAKLYYDFQGHLAI